MISSKHVAFVEYEDDLQAGIALSGKLNIGIVSYVWIGLQGRDLIEGYPLQITYAKK